MTKTMQTTASPIVIRLTSATIVNRGARIPPSNDIHRNVALKSSCAYICTELLKGGNPRFRSVEIPIACRHIKLPLGLPHNYQIRITPTTNSLRRLYRPREAHRSSMYAWQARSKVPVTLSDLLSRGVCVLRRTGPPHGGVHVGRFAAAQWASSGDIVTDSCARPRDRRSAASRQTIIVYGEPTESRRSSRAPSASENLAVADCQIVAVAQIYFDRAGTGATGIGRHPCAKSRWQE